MIHLVLMGLFLLSVAKADPNVQPFNDQEWQAAKCRFHVLVEDGAYGNHEVTSLEGCVASAQLGLMAMANTEDDESKFHEPAEVEFIDSSGTKHVCRLQSRKEKFDRLHDIDSGQVNRADFYDTMDPSLKRTLDENFEVTCNSPSM